MVIIRSIAIVCGVVGFVMNGFVLRALLSNKHLRNSYTFLTNQVIMDTTSSFLLTLVYAYKLAGVSFHYEGPGGFAVCILFYSDVLVYIIQVGSIASLVLIAAERYFKIVHPLLYRRFYKDWTTVVGIALCWWNGILMNVLVWLTSRLDRGHCLILQFWPTKTARARFLQFLVTWQFVIPLLLFIFFYGGILSAVRKRGRVFQGKYDEDLSTALQRKARRSQMNIVVTMFAVSASFVVSWFPNQFYLIFNSLGVLANNSTYRNASTLFIFLNTCVNPLIYATKHELVRRNLGRMFSKKRLKDGAVKKIQVISTVT